MMIFFFTEELRFTETLPARVITNINELLYLHCTVSFDEILDVAYIWKRNGQILTPEDNHRVVSNLLKPIFLLSSLEIRSNCD